MKGTHFFYFLSRNICYFQQLCKISTNVTNDLSPALIDSFGRTHNYLRISVAERCNLRCQYCMPEEGITLSPPLHLLSSTEIIDLARLFVKMGVTKIRITGGEPLIRKDIIEIIGALSDIEHLHSVAMTTNGIILQKMIGELKKAGLNALNISLDTLIPSKFEILTRRKGWNKVIKGIDSALEIGFNPVKINCVVMKGLNDDELVPFVKFTENKNVDIRFIEYSPFSGNKWSIGKMVPYLTMIKSIKTEFPELKRLPDQQNDTSKAYKVPGFKGQIGFITSMTENFCSSCNRLRITADGNLKVCLFGKEEISLRDALRQKMPEEKLIHIISDAVQRKKQQHAENYKPQSFGTINLFWNSKYYNLFTNHMAQVGFSTTSSSTCYKSSCTLTHVNEDGQFRMADVSFKSDSIRIAEAEAIVYLGPITFRLVEENKMKKGDVLAVANIAGIMAAKRTSELIPLCHNIRIDQIKLNINLDPTKHEVYIKSYVKTKDRTGVEMEAMTSVTVAALTIYDMCKAASREIMIKSVRLCRKTGGKEDFVKL